jgi:glucose dehydrogenase
MCRDVGLSWWIGVPTALVVVVVGALLDRAIERRYLPSRRSQ